MINTIIKKCKNDKKFKNEFISFLLLDNSKYNYLNDTDILFLLLYKNN